VGLAAPENPDFHPSPFDLRKHDRFLQNRILHYLMRHPPYLGRSFHRTTSTGLANAHFALIGIAAAAEHHKAERLTARRDRLLLSAGLLPNRIMAKVTYCSGSSIGPTLHLSNEGGGPRSRLF
jgi:hypothetical protein